VQQPDGPFGAVFPVRPGELIQDRDLGRVSSTCLATTTSSLPGDTTVTSSRDAVASPSTRSTRPRPTLCGPGRSGTGHFPAVSARLDGLCAGRPCTYLDAEVNAALYPAAVALTSLLASKYWRRQGFNANSDNVRRFLHRVADTVTDGYYPTGQDPLRHHLATGVPSLRIIPLPAEPLDANADL
jgi:hypothetical protein